MPVNLNRFFHVCVNVRDLDKSIAFYEQLGFTVTAKFVMEGHMGEVTAKAFGVSFNPINAAFLRLGGSNMLLDLCEYTDPPTSGETYRDYHNVGMGRMSFHVDNIEEVYEEIQRMGIKPLGPIGFTQPPGGEKCGVFAFHDPDGTIVEVLSGVEYMAG